MDPTYRIAAIIGARPNFVKAAPLIRRLQKTPGVTLTVIHTGQHTDANMSDVFFEQLRISRPQVMMHIQGEYHTERIGRMFIELHKHFTEHQYDAVLLFGDVNSTLAGAISASNARCPMVHVEAGLRSHDRRMPEEINRAVVDHLSALLFTTEPSATTNLIREGIPEDRIRLVGNLMIESIETHWPIIKDVHTAATLGMKPKEYLVATIHRQENTDTMESIHRHFSFLQQLATHVPVLIPLHPGTRKKIEAFGCVDFLTHLRVIDPMPYHEFMSLVVESRGVVTDSGGIQEETTHLGIPCVTLRDNTERPITLEQGSNMLAQPLPENVLRVLTHLARTDFPSRHIPLWDAQVSERIVAELLAWLQRHPI
jgi:UDP-N-acetylglucosamine 2-epimerase (non-hydrolysing)